MFFFLITFLYLYKLLNAEELTRNRYNQSLEIDTNTKSQTDILLSPQTSATITSYLETYTESIISLQETARSRQVVSDIEVNELTPNEKKSVNILTVTEDLATISFQSPTLEILLHMSTTASINDCASNNSIHSVISKPSTFNLNSTLDPVLGKTDNNININDSMVKKSNFESESADHEEHLKTSLPDDEKFLSFDKWKAKKLDELFLKKNDQKLKKYTSPSKQQQNSFIDNIIGEEMELNFDFLTGDKPTDTSNNNNLKSQVDISSNKHESNKKNENSTIATEQVYDRNEEYEEGYELEGKPYEKKFNYASIECAATVAKTNKEAQSIMSILQENKDKSLLIPCDVSGPRYIVIELCEDILIEEVVIANFEFFSSTFKKIRISVSDRFPVSKSNGWRHLGDFEMEDIMGLQAVSIESPVIWSKFLKIDILSHYRDEYYCPISLVRVYGKTMMEVFKLEEHFYQEMEESSSNKLEDGVGINEEQIEAEKDGEKVDWGVLKQSTFDFTKNIPDFFLTSENFSDVYDINNSKNGEQCNAHLPYLKFEEFLISQKTSELSPSYCRVDAVISTTVSTIEATPTKHILNNNNSDKILSSAAAAQMIINSNAGSNTEESIFRNIMKRLALLESNATFSIMYIEEQSKLLSQTFEALETHQEKVLKDLVLAMNDTIINNLEMLQQFVDILQENSKNLINIRLNDMETLFDRNIQEVHYQWKEDIVFIKRLTYTITVAFICLLIYVLMTREAYIDQYMKDDGWYDTSTSPLLKAKENLMRLYSTSPTNGNLTSANGIGNKLKHRRQFSDPIFSTKKHDGNISDSKDVFETGDVVDGIYGSNKQYSYEDIGSAGSNSSLASSSNSSRSNSINMGEDIDI
ncbi:Slp1p SCDLUD_003887 [Saccharomycodes ludwigii]|uniref:Slp1p n=1 Tax=Saccharomycodes ludwigii TaxID=36035 RepID=UPI001E88E276|nr:hypothetical protein SCDLUD_003887 [Saccharomycodes ludwigii]KAH3899607.1 hypothetical protein SCDLUD_003887 [Saccharomycodes ludwigii]